MLTQVRSLSHRRRITATSWTPLLPTAGGYYLEHWYRSDSGLWQDAGITPAAADGDVVGRWEDLTANNDHANQAVAAGKPTLQNGAGDLLNGHPVVRFDGVDDKISGAFTTGGALAQPFTVLAVVKLNAAAVNDGVSRFWIDAIGGPNFMEQGSYAVPNPDTWVIYGGAVLLSVGASNSNWNIWTTLFNGAASRFWHNGIAQCAAGNAGAAAPPSILIGGSGAGNPWAGDVVEILIYEANLSDADKNQVGQYLATRYALAYTGI